MPSNNVLLERFPYRFVDEGDRGYIEKYNQTTKRWFNMYECDSKMQLMTAMADLEYAKMLCGDPCYLKDIVVNPYK